MNPQIIRAKKSQDFGSIKVSDIINTEKYPKISIAKVERVKDGKLGYDTKSDTIYYVLKGTGKSTIEGKTHKVKEGDTIFIPRNTKYKNTKGLVFLAVSYPRFDAKKTKYIE